jgi:hypothetical protein
MDFVKLVMQIIAALTGNANFPITLPAIVDIEAMLESLNAAIIMPEGEARDTAITARRASLEQMLSDLAANLETTANHDPVMLSTTGFPMRKPTTQSSEPPGVVENVRLRGTGAPGEVQILLDPPERARGYQVQTTLDPVNGPWVDYDVFTSSRRMILTGQPHAKDLWVRVRAIGPHNTKGGWSDPATIVVN